MKTSGTDGQRRRVQQRLTKYLRNAEEELRGPATVAERGMGGLVRMLEVEVLPKGSERERVGYELESQKGIAPQTIRDLPDNPANCSLCWQK